METVRRFNDICRLFIKSKIEDEKEIVSEAEKKIFKSKHDFIKRKHKLPYYYELLKYEEIKSEFSKEELDDITRHLINKNRSLYKHAQSNKTMLCNIDIITSVKQKRFMICITKNTLEGNKQWTKRLISDLKKAFPGISLKELILVCSSKEDTIEDNATHCKNIDAVIRKLLDYNTYQVLFMCSNNTRVNDILSLLKSYENLNKEKQLPIHIQWDEAHNIKEGIPSKRACIENILMYPIVERFTPCTATASPINDEDNILWKKLNLEKNAINYTHISSIKSTSPEYSSLHKATRINFEDIKNHPSYSNYCIDKFHVDYFKKMYGDTLEKEDIDRRRQLEYHGFMKYEKDQYNMGLNILDNYYEVNTSNKLLFIPDETNLHIMSTPKRNVFTYSLMKYAVEKPYRPILFGLYKGKINLMYKDENNETVETEYADFSEDGSMKEFNEKIEACLKFLIKEKVNIKVPIIFMGNYIPTGESITFVNCNYGTIRSVILFPGTDSNPSSEYQVLCRQNYMIIKFIEKDPNFIMPESFICSYKQQIDNALIEETANDDRIDEMLAEKTETPVDFEPILVNTANDTINWDECISIPIKIQIDDIEDEAILELFKILDKEKRSPEDKKKILEIFNKGIQNKTISFIDKSNKFDFGSFTLKDVRTYRKKDKATEHTWRFPQYSGNHNQNMPYICDKNDIKQYECELYACNDRYVKDDFVNPKQRMWLSYRY